MDPKILAVAAVGTILVIGSLYVIFVDRATPPQSSPPIATTTPSTSSSVPTTTSSPTSPPSSPPSSSLPSTTTSPPTPTHITIRGEIDEVLKEGGLYFVVRHILQSDTDGYWVDVYFQNISREELLFNPIEIKVIDAEGTEFAVRYEYSQLKVEKTPVELPIVLAPYESRRVLWEFKSSRYLFKKFILVNEYRDKSTATWEIDLKQ